MRSIFNIRGKVVCIIGGTGLIGSELVKGFSLLGAYVFVGTRYPEKCQDRQKNVEYIKMDGTSSQQVKEFIATVISCKDKIDVWINCAWPRVENASGPIEEVDEGIVAEDMTKHLMGFYICCKEIVDHMKKNNKGSIINYGSIYGDLSPDFRIYQGTELKSLPSYPMIKGAIHAFTRYLACYVAPNNIRVNAVCPGGVLDKQSELFQKQYGERVPLGRMADKSEMLGAALFLASDASSYMTGHLLNVDGGLHAW